MTKLTGIEGVGQAPPGTHESYIYPKGAVPAGGRPYYKGNLPQREEADPFLEALKNPFLQLAIAAGLGVAGLALHPAILQEAVRAAGKVVEGFAPGNIIPEEIG